MNYAGSLLYQRFQTNTCHFVKVWPGGEVVTQRFAKPIRAGSIPARASNNQAKACCLGAGENRRFSSGIERRSRSTVWSETKIVGESGS